MVRSIALLVLLIAAVLWLPWWIQAVLFVGAVFAAPQPLFLVGAAIVSDALYASGTGTWISNVRVTLIALCIVGLYTILKTRTRFSHIYALEKKH